MHLSLLHNTQLHAGWDHLSANYWGKIDLRDWNGECAGTLGTTDAFPWNPIVTHTLTNTFLGAHRVHKPGSNLLPLPVRDVLLLGHVAPQPARGKDLLYLPVRHCTFMHSQLPTRRSHSLLQAASLHRFAPLQAHGQEFGSPLPAWPTMHPITLQLSNMRSTLSCLDVHVELSNRAR